MSFDAAMAAVGQVVGTFPTPFEPGEAVTIKVAVPLESVCPFDGQQDHSLLEVEYVPAGVCLELESFRRYVAGFADERLSHEEIVRAVYRLLRRVVLRPVRLVVRDTFARDGLTLTVEVGR